MKTCFKCSKEKPRSQFYRHPQMSDGHLGKCKECTKNDVLKHRQNNLDRIQTYDRIRGRDPKRKAANKQRYREKISTKTGRKRLWKQAKEWREKNKIKRAAHTLTGNAIRDGRLQKGSCERCGTTKKVHAHHEDYLKPLEVTWLCQSCHGRRHREINESKR